MATTDWKLPTIASASSGWVDFGRSPNDIKAVGGNFAYQALGSGQTSGTLIGTGFGFTDSDIPVGSTIDGIEFKFHTIKVNEGGSVNTCYLRKIDGVNVGANKASGANWHFPYDGGQLTYTGGGASDLWSTTWTDAEVKATTFGVAITAFNGNPKNAGGGGIDYFQIRIHYTPAASPPIVTDNSAAALFGVGGTVQISATNTPTSWSLLGSPPTGVSINSSGLVTWTTATPVGVHSITPRAVNGGGAGTGTLTLTITSPTPVVTNNTAGNTYGTGGTVQMAATNTPTSWSLQGSPPSGVSINSSGLVTWTGAAPVGAHSITTRATNGSGSGDGTLTLTITRAALTVTANAKSRAYGAANPAFDGVIAGFVNSETAAVLTGAASYTCAAGGNTNIGTVAITAAVGSLAAANYSFSYIDSVLTITRAPLVVTPDDKTRQIGAANPTLTGTITGFVNGETSAVLTAQPTYACTADVNTPVGTAAITASGAAADNYSFTYGTGTLTITMPVPVVTGGSLTRVYGVGGTVQLSATNTPTSWALVSPPAGVSINGSGLVTVAASAVVQTATITVGASNAGGSGIATLSLTITRAPLVVAANNKTRLTGEANPAFDGTITGYVLGETAASLTGAASFTVTATTESPAGAYVITAATGTLAAANYAFTFVNGVLTIDAPIQPIPTAAAQETAIVNTPAETLTRTAAVRAAGSVPPELRELYDALLGPGSDATGIEARAAAFGRLLSDPRYAVLTGGAPAPAPALRPGVYLSNVPPTAVVGVDAPASALTAADGRAELRVSVAVSAVGRYQIPNVPTAYIVVHSLLAPFTVDVTVRRAAGVVGGIGPGGDSTPARLNALLTPAMRAVLFGAQPSGVYAEAAALAESSRFDERLAGVLIALVRRIAALS
jgi:hypothetical protein